MHSLRKTLFVCLFLLLLVGTVPGMLAADDSLYDTQALSLSLELTNTVSIIGDPGGVDYVTADLSWWPHETYRQHVIEKATIPSATFERGVYHYEWEEPRSNRLEMTLRSTIRTTNEVKPVKEKEPFPISSVSGEAARYVDHREIIDVNDAIRKRSLMLAAGKDDLFEVVYAVADWVTTNIEYNLTTVNIEASHPSTYVYETRQGVCDELTSLFISMLRSLGIPARFISGVSYTNLPEFAQPWGGHGWAEVWFPDAGWVPFDVTYGTYGYVDTTHIKLQESEDASSTSVDFTMRARDASLMTQSLGINVEVLGSTPRTREPFIVELEPFSDISLDSHNLITATIRNTENHYVSARFQLAKTEGLELLTQQEQNLLLKPYETKRIDWVVKTEDLAEGFTYTFPVKLYAGLREVAASAFSASRGKPSYDARFFDTYIEANEETRAYDDQSVLLCDVEPSSAYVGDIVEAKCALTNEGEKQFRSLTLCVNTCENFDLLPGETKRMTDTLTCDSAGTKALLVIAKGRTLLKQALLQYECLDEAKVAIEELEHPGTLGFDERGEISFTIVRGSETLPEKAVIVIRHDNFEQAWTSEAIGQPQRFSYAIAGQHLDLDGNEVMVSVAYEDALGKKYETKETFTISPRDLTLGQKAKMLLYDFQRWVDGLLLG